MQNLSDKELIDMFKSADSRRFAFNQIILKYQERIYWHIRKMVLNHDDADDLTQDTFIKVWNSLDAFRGEAGLYTWIYRIATNEVLAFIAKQKQKNNVPFDDVANTLRNTLKSDMYFDGDDAQIKLQQALESLPPKQKLVFNMKYFDDMKYEDIAAILQTSVGALKTSYHIAVQKIQEFLKSN